MCASQATVKALQVMVRPPVWSLTGVFFYILKAKDTFSTLDFIWIPRSRNESAYVLSVWARNNLELTSLSIEA